MEEDFAEQERRAAGFGEWKSAREARDISQPRAPDKSNFFARRLLLWMWPIARIGWKRVLTKEDLPGVNKEHETAPLVAKAQAIWQNELQTKRCPSLHRVVWKLGSWNLVHGTILLSLHGLLGAVGRPLVLEALVSTVENNAEDTGAQVYMVVLFGLLVFFEGVFGVLGRQQLSEDFGNQLQVTLNGLIFNKMTKIAESELNSENSKANSGVVAENLVGNDTVRAYENLRLATNLPMAISGVLGGVVVLLYLVGIPALVGLGIMFLILFSNMYLSKVAHDIESKSVGAADTRLNILGNILFGARAVKLFGWEDKYLKRIDEAREYECGFIRRYRLAHVTSIATGRASPVVSAMGTLVVFTLTGGELSSGIAFATLSIFQALRLGLVIIPLGTTSLLTLQVSFERIKAYLVMPELPSFKVLTESKDAARGDSNTEMQHSMGNHLASGADSSTPRTEASGEITTDPSQTELSYKSIEGNETQNRSVLLQISNATFGFRGGAAGPTVITSGDTPEIATPNCEILKRVNITIASGTVVGIVGEVGSGKSTLISGIVQLLQPINDDGVVRSTSSIGYAPSEPYIISGTLRENVLMGRTFDETKFEYCLFASALKFDLEILPMGADTHIGERGTTLSGGQQARLGLARALYDNPKLLVLDDPLSAVDVKVGKHIFEHAISKRIKESNNKLACVFSLHQVTYLKQLDELIYLNKGQVSVQPSFDALVNQFPEVRELVTVQLGQIKQTPTRIEGHERLEHFGKLPSRTGTQSRDATSIVESELMGNNDGGILQEEKLTTGNITGSIYTHYIKSMGAKYSITSFLACLIGYSVMLVNDFWLAEWSSQATIVANNQANKSDGSGNITSLQVDNGYFAIGYASFTAVFAICILLASYLFVYGGVQASRTLHTELLTRLVYAPLSWFQSTNAGRITSRFSGDLAKVDMFLSLTVDNAVQVGFTLLAMVATICFVLPVMLIVVILCILFCVILLRGLGRSNREILRISNSARSPLLTNTTEARRGRGVIQVHGCWAFFQARHRIASDELCRTMYVSGTVLQFCYLQAHFVSFVLSMAAAILLVALRDTYEPAFLGLALTYAFLTPYMAAQAVQQAVRLNVYFLSLERLLEYRNVPQEGEHHISPTDQALVEQEPRWPSTGGICFEDVEMRYAPGLPLALQGVSFEVAGGTICGIVGRSGAGKSSITVALFRIVELHSGRITIDGQDIATVGLSTLRSTLTVVPQDPVLLRGTIRTNLDVFNQYTDAAMVEALRAVGLGDVTLEDEVSSNAENWSAGERQLLCFARAVLGDNHRILVLDEATSSMDSARDAAIQKFVLEHFVERHQSTILCVAHRINTILGYDQVMVMDKGRVIEKGSVSELLADRKSAFSELANGTHAPKD